MQEQCFFLSGFFLFVSKTNKEYSNEENYLGGSHGWGRKKVKMKIVTS